MGLRRRPQRRVNLTPQQDYLPSSVVSSGPASSQTVTPTGSGIVPLTLVQSDVNTDALIIQAPAGSNHIASFTMSGSTTSGPLYHFNQNGFGAVGADTAANPYIAVEDSFALNSILKLSISGPSSRHAIIDSQSNTGASTPEINIRAASHIRLIPSRNLNGTSSGSGYVFVQAPNGLAIQDFASTGAGQLLLSRATTDCTIRANDVTNAQKPTLTVKSAGDLRLQPGFLNDGSGFDTTQNVLVQAPGGFYVQDTAGLGAGQAAITRTTTTVVFRGSDASSTTNPIDVYLRARTHVRLQAGYKNDGTSDTAGLVISQSVQGFAVQDMAGANTLFWARNPGASPLMGFFGATPVAKQTGGAATATGTWTATEQGMLQRAYDALRNYGLLT